MNVRSTLLASLVLVACVGDSPQGVSPPDSGVLPDSSTPDAAALDAAVDAPADVQPDAPPLPPSGDFQWYAHMGGVADDDNSQAVLAAAFDASGALFVAGNFSGQASFGNAQSLTSLGALDGFIAKYDTAGLCVGVARIGGLTQDGVTAMAVDPVSGDVVVTGSLFDNGSLAFPIKWSVNGGQNNLTNNGAFLVKLSNDLSTVKFQQDYGPNSSATNPRSLALGPAGAIAVAGTLNHQAQIPFANSGGLVSASTLGGPSTGFVAQYSSSGAFAFARILSSLTNNGGCETFVSGVGYDSQKRLVIAGSALGYGNPCNYTADYASNQSVADLSTSGGAFFIAKYDANNNGVYLSSKVTAPVTGFGYPGGFALGPKDEVYAGFEQVSSSFTFGGKVVPAGASHVGLVLSWDGGGTEKAFLQFGKTGNDVPASLAVDALGNVVLGGSISEDVDFGGGKSLKLSGGTNDGFVLKTDANLLPIWVNPYGGAGNERILGVAVAPGSGRVGAHGVFDDASFSVALGQNITRFGTANADGFAVSLKP